MRKIKVVFLGSRPLGFHALNLLKGMDNIEIVGAVVKVPSKTAWWSDDPYNICDSKIMMSHEDLHLLDFDFGVSINYWKIIEPELIAKPSLGFINTHHSYMLSLRGRDMTSIAIQGARKKDCWFHGSSLHYTDDGLDTGPIIAAESCEITESDTAWSLFRKVDLIAEKMLEIWLPRILRSRPPVAFPEPMHPLNLKTDGNAKFIIDIFRDSLDSYDIVRSYDFNNVFEPASTKLNNELVYLTVQKEFGSEVLLEIDSSRKIYKNIAWIQ